MSECNVQRYTWRTGAGFHKKLCTGAGGRMLRGGDVGRQARTGPWSPKRSRADRVVRTLSRLGLVPSPDVAASRTVSRVSSTPLLCLAIVVAGPVTSFSGHLRQNRLHENLCSPFRGAAGGVESMGTGAGEKRGGNGARRAERSAAAWLATGTGPEGFRVWTGAGASV